MQTGDIALHLLHSWNFRPDIGFSNIKAKLPEKAVIIKIAMQIDLLITGSSGTRPRDQ